ncbi:hypothetical protein DM860_017482 [Cuscuta australis]|uniref:Pectinesterase inhibitor domain-containing protein n=1 Tax=Cuscuta australis TaxID=267555 RepID=A0A328E0L5_9ASTE|nr:hypothetical protein DM860_017482 [Cuscuta australis]
MKSSAFSIHVFHLLLAGALFISPSAADVPLSPAPSPCLAATENNDTAEFIRTSCQITLYPEVCYHSLLAYAGSVQRDHAKLALAAIGVSLRGATQAAAHVKSLSASSQAATSASAATAALRDCFSALRDTVDQMRDSLAQMRQLGGDTEALRFQISNVQTWMSAAETNEDTCLDGFESVADGPLKTDVCDRVGKVVRLTSNALALVNYFAN